MKSARNIIVTIVFIGILVAQMTYLLTSYKDDMQKINDTQAEIDSVNMQITGLEERLKMLPETEREIEILEEQRVALLNTIPSMGSAAKDMVDLTRYLGMCDFMNREMTLSTVDEPIVNNEITVYVRKYMMSFVGTYEDVHDFVGYLNSAYQLINITSFSMDNAIQNSGEEEKKAFLYHYGDDFYNLVSANIEITYYLRLEEADSDDEIYQPFFDGRVNTTTPFKMMNTEEIEEVELLLEAPEQVSVPISVEQKNDYFSLDIGDALNSGDTYKLSGPGGNNYYVGIESSVNTMIRITVYNEYYILRIEDESGKIDEVTVNTPITKPYLQINSSMRQIQEVMPNVKIYVDNYSQNIMEVEMRGSLLENVYIYNQLDTQVMKGETKGNVKLT